MAFQLLSHLIAAHSLWVNSGNACTECMNAVFESYFYNFCNFAQDNWSEVLPMAQLAIANQTAASTGFSPFFLDHGFHLETLQLAEPVTDELQQSSSSSARARIADKLKNALEVAQKGIHPVFHVDLLWPAANDPFPSQCNDDYQPPAVLVDGKEEYQVEHILDYQQIRCGRGFQRQYLVKWTGYLHPEWTAAHNMKNTAALDEWEQCHEIQSSTGDGDDS
ncbi:hypothetical protein SI65_00499 [Aspergillus cristatus]|uniref:Chromo domain-containing protein n=1 Tax=Aspergillus cristatus TaxID=573508 RepID=A0A1E3BPM0_ASPCR|nr:hypothetical protein SI65_00499 [Aspergillus cristatus]